MQWLKHPMQAVWNENHFSARNYSAKRTEYQFQLYLNSDFHVCACYYVHTHMLPFDVSISVVCFNGFLLHWWRVLHPKHLFLQPFLTLDILFYNIILSVNFNLSSLRSITSTYPALGVQLANFESMLVISYVSQLDTIYCLLFLSYTAN